MLECPSSLLIWEIVTPALRPNSAYVRRRSWGCNSGLPISEFGVEHPTITGKQHSLYSDFAKTGETLTFDVMREIEIEAMTKSEVPLNYATNAVNRAIQALINSGVTQPIRIPWTK